MVGGLMQLLSYGESINNNHESKVHENQKLHTAIVNNDLEAVIDFLRNDGINLHDVHIEYLFECACSNNNIEMVKILINDHRINFLSKN